MNGFQQMMHQPLSLIRYGFFTLLLVASALAQANVAGHVIMVRGDVIARSADGVERKLERRSEVLVADTLMTGAGSRVQIRFIDNAMLALSEHTQLSIEAYQQASQNGTQDKVVMNLLEGGFRTLTGSIGKGNPDAYRVDTPAASIGIRGTLYSAHYRNNQLSAGVWQGGIRLFTPQGNFNLGQDAAFNFARVTPQGFQGLLNQPQELDSSPSQDSDHAGQQDNANNDDAGTQNQEQAGMNAPQPAFLNDAEQQPNPLTAQINPLENNGSDNAAGILQDDQGLPINPSNQGSLFAKLTAQEVEELENFSQMAWTTGEDDEQYLLRLVKESGRSNTNLFAVDGTGQDITVLFRADNFGDAYESMTNANNDSPDEINQVLETELGITWQQFDDIQFFNEQNLNGETDTYAWIEFTPFTDRNFQGEIYFGGAASAFSGKVNGDDVTSLHFEGTWRIDLTTSGFSGGVLSIEYDGRTAQLLAEDSFFSWQNNTLQIATTITGAVGANSNNEVEGHFKAIITTNPNEVNKYGMVGNATFSGNTTSDYGNIIFIKDGS